MFKKKQQRQSDILLWAETEAYIENTNRRLDRVCARPGCGWIYRYHDYRDEFVRPCPEFLEKEEVSV